MMTKPAGCAAQLGGAVMLFLSIGAFSDGNTPVGWFLLLIGGAFFVAGGHSARQHMKRETGR